MILKALKDFAYLARLYTLDYRSPAAIRSWQSKELRRLLMYASANIPLWQELCTQRGIKPAEIRDIRQLDALPVITKDVFRSRQPEEYIDNSRGIPTTSWIATSGSTGKPWSMVSSNEKWRRKGYGDFVWLRFLIWRGIPLSKLSSVIRVAKIKMTPERDSPTRLFVPLSDFQERPREVIERLIAFKPDILVSYATVLLQFAQAVSESNIRFRTSYAISYGEILTPMARQMITEVLQCEIYDRYGIEEIGVIGVECTQHDGFHVFPESAIVEIVDEHGNTRPPGMHGRVVVTDLLNYSMPFIRYDTGDHGVISEESCACGLSITRLWIDGRHSAYLTFGNRRVHHLEFDGVMNAFSHAILQFQVVKEAADQMTLSVVPAALFSTDLTDSMIHKLHDLVGDQIRITIRKVSKVPQIPRGKSQTLRDESATASERIDS